MFIYLNLLTSLAALFFSFTRLEQSNPSAHEVTQAGNHVSCSQPALLCFPWDLDLHLMH